MFRWRDYSRPKRLDRLGGNFGGHSWVTGGVKGSIKNSTFFLKFFLSKFSKSDCYSSVIIPAVKLYIHTSLCFLLLSLTVVSLQLIPAESLYGVTAVNIVLSSSCTGRRVRTCFYIQL